MILDLRDPLLPFHPLSCWGTTTITFQWAWMTSMGMIVFTSFLFFSILLVNHSTQYCLLNLVSCLMQGAPSKILSLPAARCTEAPLPFLSAGHTPWPPPGSCFPHHFCSYRCDWIFDVSLLGSPKSHQKSIPPHNCSYPTTSSSAPHRNWASANWGSAGP